MQIGNFFKKIIFNIKLLWHSLFYGIKVAEQKTMGVTKEGSSEDSTIEQQVTQDNVYADLLKGEVTQEVENLRDSSYRGYKASFDYKYIGNGNSVKKETMLSDDVNVYNPDNLHVALVQDNKLITQSVKDVLDGVEDNDDVKNENKDFTLIMERDNFPRFHFEQYVKKIVVRDYNGIEKKIDLYCSVYPRLKRPTDSIFITEMEKIMNNDIKPTDTILIDSVEFVTDGCYGAKDITFYRFSEMQYEEINVYDGNFVITYSGIAICDGLDLTEQYKTEEMNKKYKEKAAKEGATIMMTEKEVNTLNVNEALSVLSEYSK